MSIEYAMGPLVSIVMPAYNAERYIGEAIQSVLAQTERRWELLVVNDGSSDRTADVVSAFRDRRIHLHNQMNGGQSVALNLALRRSKGELVAFLDSDDCFLPDTLSATLQYLRSHPEFDAVYTDGFYVDAHMRRLCRLSERRRGPFQGDIFEELVRASDAIGGRGCTVLRAEPVMRRGLEFDPAIRIGQDWEFLIRFAETGRFGYLDRNTYCYRIHSTNISGISGRNLGPERTASLAMCREKTIKLKRFRECSVSTRSYVFYDLLINLLSGQPERQVAATQYPEFNDLPSCERARLLRLLASESLLNGGERAWVAECLRRSAELDPANVRAAALRGLHHISPLACRLTVRAKRWHRGKRAEPSLFSRVIP